MNLAGVLASWAAVVVAIIVAIRAYISDVARSSQPRMPKYFGNGPWPHRSGRPAPSSRSLEL
jgi:hypothetical protein